MEIVSFGFKYGRPSVNHYFDVSFLPNPARRPEWTLKSPVCSKMRQFLLETAEFELFVSLATPVIHLLSTVDVCRIGIGCSAGRHRSAIVAEELAKRLINDYEFPMKELEVFHRELSEKDFDLDE